MSPETVSAAGGREQRPDAPLPPWPLVGVAVVATALVAAALPLLTYTLSLAAFGLVHVLAELRYLDARFAARTGRALRAWLGLLLAGVVLLRLGDLAGWLPGPRAGAELALVALLAAGALPLLWRAGSLRLFVGVALVLGLGAAIVVAPIPALLLLAVLHNLTPVGFLAERLRGAQRRRVLLVCGVVFLLVPAGIAAGLPTRLLAEAGGWAPEWSLLPVGPLEAHLGAFLPSAWWQRPWAIDLFAAAVYLQCMHYAAVIHVLPRLSDPDLPAAGAVFPWPSRRCFLLALAGVAALTLVGFGWAFAPARRLYGVAAAVHAWIELPLLLLALAGSRLDPVALAPENARGGIR